MKKLLSLANMKKKEKIKTMRQNPQWGDIFFYAYNPFKRYYLTIPDTAVGEGKRSLMGNGQIKPDIKIILEELSLRILSGDDAKDVALDTIESLTSPDGEILKGILNKDLRLSTGITTINCAYPGLIPLTYDKSDKPPLMLCKNIDWKKISYPVMAAIKKDGVRCRISNGNLYTRSGQKFVGFSHIRDELEIYDFDLDGEMCVPGMKFDGSSGLIRNSEEVPSAELWLFDAPSHHGDKKERFRFMDLNITRTKHIKIIPHMICHTQDELMLFYDLALSQGDEGLVVYSMDHQYRDCRSYDWCRLIPVQSAECFVVDFIRGKGKLEETLGNIIVDFGGRRVNVGTGFAEKIWSDLSLNERNKVIKKYGLRGDDYNQITRNYIWDNREEFKGKLAQLEYKEKTKTGSMRQPRFKGWRLDKCQPNIN